MSDRATLKGFFETGDKPTQTQFADLIDSQINLDDDMPVGSDGRVVYNNGGAVGQDANLVWNDTDGRLLIGGATSTAQISLAGRGSLATGMSFNDGNTGIFEDSEDDVVISVAANDLFRFESSGLFQSVSSNRPSVQFGADNSGTSPGFIPHKGDMDTGVGSPAADQLSHITGGVEGLRLEEASSHVLFKYETHAGITASTTQTQGNGLLLSSYNEISTVANANDTVTLPSAAAGYKVLIINNGANTLQIFPNTSDNLGAGVDTATTLASGSNVTYFAYDATNWESI